LFKDGFPIPNHPEDWPIKVGINSKLKGIFSRPHAKAKRQQFIQELLTALPIHPVTVPVALRVGQIDGENQAKGLRLPLADLLIGVTALELDYSVATGNLRHFQRIPGLSVVQL
jgi:predicted nucleic acid-binding protein